MAEWRYKTTTDARSGVLILIDGIGERHIVNMQAAGPGHIIDTGKMIADALNRRADPALDALVKALREIDRIATRHQKGTAGEMQRIARAALSPSQKEGGGNG